MYNTNNPVGSSDLRDIWDNADTFDQLINGDSIEVTSRTGKALKGIAALQSIITSLDLGSFTFSDTASGLAGTTSGQYFRVPQGPDASASFIYYKNDNGSAAEIARLAGNSISEDVADNSDLVSQLVKSATGIVDYRGAKYPVIIDKQGNIMLAYDDQLQVLNGLGISRSDVEEAIKSGLGFTNYHGQTTGIIPLHIGNNNNIILGYDASKNELVGLFPSLSYISSKDLMPFEFDEVETNYLLGYGQSLSTGVRAQSVISSNQPFSNLTFGSGVRGNGGDFSAVKPLIEDDAKPTPDGEPDAAETVCSGSANFASLCMLKENGVNPASHIIFSSTAGHGAYTIQQLARGSAWYTNQLLKHLNGANSLNDSIALHAVAWLQGETNSNDKSYTKATHKKALLDLQAGLTTDAQNIFGQSSPVMFLTYQHSSRVKINDAVPLALLEVCQQSDYFYFVAPTYPFPHYTDGLHLLAEGYKWIGAYYGRAYKQAVIDKKKPLSINPISALYRENVIEVFFDVPFKPLVLDTDTLAKTKDYGFSVYVAGTAQSISSIAIGSDGNSVVITLGANPSSAPEVRYAFDNLGDGLNISNGASGNLRDSCSDTCFINNETKPMYYICPHFKLTATSEVF
ncbi:hypothetical protein HGT70_04095 [Rosenbergiella collisarenosi]|uniref:hypothetical protein n=1 Tax=Rosenbergiella collisarenosi TaxID=1544695 RepID=UPI001BD96804|nr:hypothetical protein [Rosenbergiella collisarenosi]MBT0720462.1 hypothetical protein [Rosenbergiella collisarenosi]